MIYSIIIFLLYLIKKINKILSHFFGLPTGVRTALWNESITVLDYGVNEPDVVLNRVYGLRFDEYGLVCYVFSNYFSERSITSD